MKNKRTFNALLVLALFLALAPTIMASTTWYVNGVSGSDKNHCISPQTAFCKTIGHAISLAASGDSIMVAAATYSENLTISKSLKIYGSGAATTIVDGGGINCPAKFSFTSCTVVTIYPATTATVILSGLTIRNGSPQYSMFGSDGDGGGINNINGTLTINNSTVTGNVANGGGCTFLQPRICYGGVGGGINNINGTLTINNSTISGNVVTILPSIVTGCRNRVWRCSPGKGGGIVFSGTLTINNSTISGNTSGSIGGGILTYTGALTISSSTISGNSAGEGGGIQSYSGTLTISSSTISGNSAGVGGGIAAVGGTVKFQNSILANSTVGGNCSGTMTSIGYNISSDETCNFSSKGDWNNTDPMLGPLQNNLGPTWTMALKPGSPAIDAGNPSGCRDAQGNLLTTDQRGYPRHDPEDTSGCDIGAFEKQSD